MQLTHAYVPLGWFIKMYTAMLITMIRITAKIPPTTPLIIAPILPSSATANTNG